VGNLGDTSTLADPSVVDDLVKNRAARRGDDAIVISGHKLSAAEIEAALVRHDAVAEAAVIGFAGSGKDESIQAFVVLEPDANPTDVLQADLKGWLRREVSTYAAPEVVQFVRALPKTPSGEVVRPMLRRAAEGASDLGDASGLADPSVAAELVKGRAAAPA
jgi:acetyl-CoA synthetase